MNIVKFPVTDQVKISYLKFEENSRPRYLNKLNQMTRFLNQNVLLTCSWFGVGICHHKMCGLSVLFLRHL